MKKKFLFGASALLALALVGGTAAGFGMEQKTVGVSAASETADELPENWSFTKGADGDSAKHVYDLANGHYAQITSTSSNLSSLRSLANVTGGKTYNVTFKAKVTNSAKLTLNIVQYKGNDALVATEIGGLKSATDWAERNTRFTVRSDADRIAFEALVRGKGEVDLGNIQIHEGSTEDADYTNIRFFTGTESNATSGTTITEEHLVDDGNFGKAAKLTAGTGLYLPWTGRNQFVGRFKLRFRYRYVDQKATSGKSGAAKLGVRLDSIKKDGTRTYYGDSPKAGWTYAGSWEIYEYDIIAKAGTAEPVYVTIACSQNGSDETADYYLIDDIEVLSENGTNLISGGTFDTRTNAKGDALLGFFDGSSSKAEPNMGSDNFVSLPAEHYVQDGYNSTRAIHLSDWQGIGLIFPTLAANDTYTLSLKYRKTDASRVSVRLDHVTTAGAEGYYASLPTNDKTGEWAETSFKFLTTYPEGSDKAGNNRVTNYMVITVRDGEMDLDSLSLKDSKGQEYIFQGSFDGVVGGGTTTDNHASAYLLDDGTYVYSAKRNVSMASTTAIESYLGIDELALGLINDQTYTLSFDYWGGSGGNTASVSDKATWLLGTVNASTTWTSRSVSFKAVDGRALRIYGSGYNYPTTYIRNISIKDVDGNELFTPYANGKSIFPQGAMFVNSHRVNIDAMLEVYFYPAANTDYTTIAEADRVSTCQNNYKTIMSKIGYLSSEDQEYFKTAEEYASVRAIIEQWKNAGSTSSIGNVLRNSNESTMIWVIAGISLATIAVSAALLLSRKKKQN